MLEYLNAMNRTFKSLSFILFFLFLIRTSSYGQVIQKDNYKLDLANTDRKIENIIRLYISDSQYEKLRSTTGEKVNIRSTILIINGDTIKPKDISTRGQSTLMFRRKSLSISLKSKASFRHGDRAASLNKFSLLNLSMDKYYCRNRLAFEMMEALGIFDLFYSFCELRINDRSEGVFMIMETPENWALREKKSPLVLRRGYDHRIDKTKGNQKDRTADKKYISNYNQLYRSLDKNSGEGLYKILSEYIDLEGYMKWLAFNFMVRNGDYSDEVFFYIDPEIEKYRIIPWDYDDIFAITPHEGKEQRNKILGDKLIFSSEDILDQKIATDPYLYERYLKMFKEVLDELSPELLKNVIENSYAELYPFYSAEEIISNAKFDNYKDASLDNLKDYMLSVYLSLSASRNNYLEYLKTRSN
jgi:spore coat protein H